MSTLIGTKDFSHILERMIQKDLAKSIQGPTQKLQMCKKTRKWPDEMQCQAELDNSYLRGWEYMFKENTGFLSPSFLDKESVGHLLRRIG